MTKKPAQITSGLIAKKGAAAPVSDSTHEPKPEPVKTKPPSIAETVAITVRLEPALYNRLKMLGATMRKSNQDMGVEALEAYIERHADELQRAIAAMTGR